MSRKLNDLSRELERESVSVTVKNMYCEDRLPVLKS